MNEIIKAIIGLTFIIVLDVAAGRGKGLNGMEKSKFLPPYQNNGRTTYMNTRNKSGVYIIKENGTVVYVGHSQSNLYKTLYRHFQEWKHPYQEVITYKGKKKDYTVRVILTTPSQAPRLEAYLVNKYQPRDNSHKLSIKSEEGKKDYDHYQTAEIDNSDVPF